MSVHEKQTVDRCGLASDGTALLIIYCPGLLGQDYTFEDLAEKAETYLEFILSGQLLEAFPECKGKPGECPNFCVRGGLVELAVG